VLKGSREATLTNLQQVSIHGQISLDLQFVLADDPSGLVHTARLGPEAIAGDPRPGDRVRVDFTFGVVTALSRIW
jgi:hypothetical protein